MLTSDQGRTSGERNDCCETHCPSDGQEREAGCPGDSSSGHISEATGQGEQIGKKSPTGSHFARAPLWALIPATTTAAIVPADQGGFLLHCLKKNERPVRLSHSHKTRTGVL